MAPPPADVSLEVVEAFLREGIEAMRSEATREALRSLPAGSRPGPKLVELQGPIWERLGVPAERGRAAVAGAGRLFPDAGEAVAALREDFARAVDAAYLQGLRDRRPEALERRAELPRLAVLEFLEACCVRLDEPAVRARLRERVEETGAMPDAVVNAIHDEVMEDLLGFEKEHGRRCFEALGAKSEFAQDRDVAVCYARWRGKTSSVCLKLLYDHKQRGGVLNVDDEVQGKLLELQAKEELDAMSQEARCEMLQRNAKKVNVFRALPSEARRRYLEKLDVREKLDLAKSEILMVTLLEAQQRQPRAGVTAAPRLGGAQSE